MAWSLPGSYGAYLEPTWSLPGGFCWVLRADGKNQSEHGLQKCSLIVDSYPTGIQNWPGKGNNLLKAFKGLERPLKAIQKAFKRPLKCLLRAFWRPKAFKRHFKDLLTSFERPFRGLLKTFWRTFKCFLKAPSKRPSKGLLKTFWRTFKGFLKAPSKGLLKAF